MFKKMLNKIVRFLYRCSVRSYDAKLKNREVKQMSFINFRPNVRRTKETDPLLALLEPVFAKEILSVDVTSILRSPEDQLLIIQDLARKAGFLGITEFLDMKRQVIFQNESVFLWQLIWSRLLNAKIIVNPPIPAKVLLDYYRGDKNVRGQIINPSPHFYGKSVDFGGGKSIDKIYSFLLKLKEDPKYKIKNVLLERNNNCIHIDFY